MPEATSEAAAAKAAMREAAKARRAAISADERQRLAHRLTGLVLDLLSRPGPRAAGPVSAFLSIGEELDTAPLIAALVAAGIPVCLPVMQGKARPLLFRAWRPGEPLATRQWGIREPEPSAPALEPAVLLLPLLAFDRAGHRLGYGGGYYDRTLRELRRRRTVLAVGLAFDQQEVDAVPHLDYDERIDWIVTPTRAIEVPA